MGGLQKAGALNCEVRMLESRKQETCGGGKGIDAYIGFPADAFNAIGEYRKPTARFALIENSSRRPWLLHVIRCLEIFPAALHLKAFSTPIGARRAALRARPAWWTTSTTSSTSL